MPTIDRKRTKRVGWPDDPKELPIYSVAYVARSLLVSPELLADWTKPHVHAGARIEKFRPLIELPGTGLAEGRFSFYNVIDAHMLLAMRRYHKLPMLTVRRSIQWIRETLPSKHPLSEYTFETKGKHLFIQKLLEDHDDDRKSETIDASQGGQKLLGNWLDLYLSRIKRDESTGVAFRLFPIVPETQGESSPVMMDIGFASGKLVIADTGILVSVVHGRHLAGHTLEKLAADYRLSRDRIREAIDYFEKAA